MECCLYSNRAEFVLLRHFHKSQKTRWLPLDQLARYHAGAILMTAPKSKRSLALAAKQETEDDIFTELLKKRGRGRIERLRALR